jgi:Helicase associated domain
MKGEVEKAEKKSASKKASKGPSVSKLERWNIRLEQCKAFRKQFGHCKIPTNYKENKALGIWVQETRRNFKLAKQGLKAPRCPLTDEQIAQLDGVEFHWGWTPDPATSAESEASWEANFAKLQEYKDSSGNFDVPIGKGVVGLSSLGTWVRVQRHQNYLRDTKRSSRMTKSRVDKLKSIDFDFDGDRDVPTVGGGGSKKSASSTKKKPKANHSNSSTTTTTAPSPASSAATTTSTPATTPDATINPDDVAQQLIHVGSRVAVYWEGEDEYFDGTVTKERFGGQKANFLVDYDDGDKAWIDFAKVTFRVLQEASRNVASDEE